MLSALRVAIARIRAHFSRRAQDDDFARELDSHLAMLTEENIRRGMSPQEARRLARLKLGGSAQLQETNRDLRGLPFLESFAQDVRFAIRMLRKSPGFAAVAILTLALGIGANTAISSVTYGILIKPLPFPDSSRLVQVWVSHPKSLQHVIFLTPSGYDQIRSRAQAFEQVAACNETYAKVSANGPFEFFGTTAVSGNFLSMLGVQPILGRPILPGDAQPGHNQVALLSYDVWQRRFGGSADIVGKTIALELQGTPHESLAEAFTVIGVLPPLFPLPSPGGNQLLIPLVASENNGQAIVIGRLKQSVTLAQANAELHTIAAGLAAQGTPRDAGIDLSAALLRDRVSEGYSTRLLVLLGAVGFVLLLACVNVSSLLIARGWERRREVAVRETLGATPWRLTQQFLTEAAVLALPGTALGLLFARWGLSALISIAPLYTPRLKELGLDGNIVVYTLAVSAFAVLVLAVVPAWLISKPNLDSPLKEGGCAFAGRTSRRSHFVRNLLVVSEIALAFLLVVGATLALRSLAKLTSVNMGFRVDHILTMFIQLSPPMRANQDASAAAVHEILQRTRSLPGVENAAIAEWRPLASTRRGDIQPKGHVESVPAEFQFASPQYFSTLGIPLLAGRALFDSDTMRSPLVAVVNQRMAQLYFNGNPLGKQFAAGKDKDGKPIQVEIVGEVGDSRDSRLSLPPAPAFFAPFTQKKYFNMGIWAGSLLVRTTVNPTAVSDAVRAQIFAVDPEAVATGIETMDQIAYEQVAEPRFQTQLFGAFGALGLVLAIVGIYGVLSYTAAQHTHEIGVRIALGASAGNIVGLLLGEALLLASIGIAIGAAAGLALTRFMQSLLFEVKPNDPFTFVGVALLLSFVALAASYIPARRAMRVDPMVALRYE